MKQLGPGVAVLYSRAEGNGRRGLPLDPGLLLPDGRRREGAVLVLAPGERLNRQYLFLRSLDPDAERWTGVREPRRFADANARIRRGDTRELAERVARAVGRATRSSSARAAVLGGGPTRARGQPTTSSVADHGREREEPAARDRAHARRQGRRRARAHGEGDREHDRGTARGRAAIRPGVEENWIAGLIDLSIGGAVDPRGVPSIVGSGPNSCISITRATTTRSRRARSSSSTSAPGRSRYAADITRTYPADGHFSPEQRKIYELVLRVQNSASR